MMTELLNDIKLKKRIGLKGFSSVADGHAVLDELRWKGSKTGNCWTLAEWSSNRLLKDERFEEVLIGGGIRYRNKMKNRASDREKFEENLKNRPEITQ